MTIQKQLPQAADAEKALLGSMLISVRAICGAVEKLHAESLCNPVHQIIWGLIVGQWSERKPVDFVTITQRAEDSGQLEAIGGAVYITELSIFVSSPASWEYYAEVIRDKAQARAAIDVANRILEAAYNPENERTITEVVQSALIEIAGFSESKSETKHIRDIVARRLDHIENLATRGNKLEGVPTGIRPLDIAIRGLRPGNMIVIAAATKGGKTSLALNIAANAAEAGFPVGIFSLEMNESEIADRLISARAGVDLSVISERPLGVRDVQKVMQAVSELGRTNIYIRDENSMTPLQFRAGAQKMVAQHGCKLLILDYAQLVQPSGKDDNRERQVAEVSRTVKTTASELGIPIIVLSQLNENGRSRESRSIEHDANIFAVIEEDERGEYWLDIKLARDCAKARIPLTFRKQFTSFVERDQS